MEGCQDIFRSPALHRATGPHNPMNTLVFFIFSGLMLGLVTLINGKQWDPEVGTPLLLELYHFQLLFNSFECQPCPRWPEQREQEIGHGGHS